MRVLVTGGSGNIGSHVVTALLRLGFDAAIFDRRANPGEVQTVLGDLRDRASIARALEGVDAVIHLAAILPPVSEQNVALSASVNVEGTRNVIAAMEASAGCHRLVFASTTAVHGSRANRRYPITAGEPLAPPDHYARQKVQAEQAVGTSSLDWTILRVPAVPPTKVGKGPPGALKLFFKIPADGRIEVLHPADAGTAFANAVRCDSSIGKILMIGGGRTNGCQVTGYELATAVTSALGMGPLPRSLFGTDTSVAHAEWLDTEESEALLHYQQHSLEDLKADLRADWGPRRFALVNTLAPLLRVAARLAALR